MDSGGTLTERTNESKIALETALKRLSCIYSLAFRDADFREGRRKSFSVSLHKKGLRAAHASAYVLRTESMKRESIVRAAYFSPRSFDTGTVHAALLTLGPTSDERWKSQIAVTVDVASASQSPRDAELGVVLSRGTSLVHHVAKIMEIGGTGLGFSGRAALTFLEPITLPAGNYVLSAVLSDPGSVLPQSVQVAVELPELPHLGPFLVGPIVGRRVAPGRVVRGGAGDPPGGSWDAVGDDGGIEPLVNPRIDSPANLVVITKVCDAEHDDGITTRLVGRSLRSSSGRLVQEFEPVRVSLEGPEPVRCGSLVDLVSADSLRYREDYAFEARLLEDASAPTASVRFSIMSAGGAEPQVRTGSGP